MLNKVKHDKFIFLENGFQNQKEASQKHCKKLKTVFQNAVL